MTLKKPSLWCLFLIQPLLLFLNFLSYAQIHYGFENFSKEGGYTQGFIESIYQDSKGFLWISSAGSLVRYDGYTFKSYLSHGAVAIHEHKSGNLYLVSGSGLEIFDPKSETITSFLEKTDSLLIGRAMRSIVQDSEGNYWIGAGTSYENTGGLVYFNQSTKQFKKYNDGNMDYVNSLVFDEFGNLWVAANGISIWDPSKRKVLKRFTAHGEELNNPVIDKLFKEKDGTIWACTKDGVSKISYTKEYSLQFETLRKNPKEKNSLINNVVFSMMKDQNGDIWFSTFDGISVYNQRTKDFSNFQSSESAIDGLKESRSNVTYQDRAGNIWIGHFNMGLTKIKPNKGFVTISTEAGILKGNNVSTVYSDETGHLWAAVVDRPIHQLDFRGNYYQSPTVEVLPSPHRRIMSILKNDNEIWMAGQEFGGVFLLNKKDQVVKSFREFNQATRLLKDHQKSVWLLTDDGGVFKIKNNSSRSFVNLLPDKDINTKFKKLTYSDLSQDHKNRIWVTDWSGEIYSYDSATEKFFIPEIKTTLSLNLPHINFSTFKVSRDDHIWVGSHQGLFKFKINDEGGKKLTLTLEKLFTEKDGLIKNGKSNLYTTTMEEDLHGNLWLAQNSGLYKLNPKTGVFKIYSSEDGMSGDAVSQWASCKLENGFFAFGTTTGLTIFHPDSLKDNLTPPQIAITDFQVLNQSAPVGKKSSDQQFTITQAPAFIKEIEIPYHVNVIGFEFAALDFTAPQKNQYAYQMVGFDKDWVYAGNKRTATYTNLDPGNYTFKVKGSNNDGIWNEEGTSVKIIILPPPWKTWWAYTGYCITASLLLIFARKEIINRERLRSEVRLKELEKNRYKELDTLKSQFFSNISHEFRTPLTLILGPLQKLLAKGSGSEKTELSIMQRNAMRLLNLVNQLLDLSRLEAGALKIKCSEGSLNQFVASVASQFFSIASSRKINFDILNEETINLYFDEDKLNKIISNLLSNAFKFTPDGGTIQVVVKKGIPTKKYKEGYAAVEVSDTGSGIGKQHLDKIFDRFYQADHSSIREHEGAGIGLALTKELVQLHRGEINVTSSPNGSIFTVLLPLGKSHLTSDEIIELGARDNSNMVTNPMETTSYLTDESKLDEPPQSSLPTILIVEDNPDLRYYLKENLNEHYSLLQAENGEQGIAEALRTIPDLIITDLMMPKINGLQLCQRLKEDEKTSHIPILLLTAKADTESKIEGFHIGADDYIAKPFDIHELEARVQSLIANRKKLHEKYARQMVLKPKEIKVSSIDDRFLQKLMELVEKNLSNTSLSVDLLADEIAMSNIQLYRKLKALTGNGPNDFIRNFRLERAASLLTQKAGGVSDIAYQVGFNNLSYFSKCFKDKFGKTPIEFLK